MTASDDGEVVQRCKPKEWVRAIRRLDLPGSTKATANALAWFADFRTGAHAHPGNDVLSAQSGISKRTTITNLATLRNLGLIVRTFEGSAAGRRGQADEYQLCLPGDIAERVNLLPLTREHRA